MVMASFDSRGVELHQTVMVTATGITSYFTTRAQSFHKEHEVWLGGQSR